MTTSHAPAASSRRAFPHRAHRARRPLPVGFAPVKDTHRDLLNNFQQARLLSLSQYSQAHLVEPSLAGTQLAALVDAVIDGRPAVCRADGDGFTLLVGGATLNFTRDCSVLESYTAPSRTRVTSPARAA